MGPSEGVFWGVGGMGVLKSQNPLPCGSRCRAHAAPTSPQLRCWGSVWAQPESSPRFDLMGLTPDAPEDEAGIKKAAENSKKLWGGGSAELLDSSPSLGWGQMLHLSLLSAPLSSHPPSPRLNPNMFGP